MKNNTEIDEQSNSKFKLSKIKLDDADIQIINETVEHVNDKYLKQKLLRVMRKDFTLKKLKKQNNWHQCASCTVLCPPDQTLL